MADAPWREEGGMQRLTILDPIVVDGGIYISDCLPVQEIFSFGIDGGEFIASLQYTNGFLAALSGIS